MRRKMISIICISMLLSQGCSRTERVNVSESSGVESSAEVSSEEKTVAEETSSEGETEIESTTEEIKTNRVEADPDEIYDFVTNKLSDEQKKIIESRPEGLPYDSPRLILTLMGKLPEDCPRLTKEEAKQIIEELMEKEEFSEYFEDYNVELIRKKFEDIAGTYDNMGSGELSYTYFLNDECTELVTVGTLVGVTYKGPDGSEKIGEISDGELAGQREYNLFFDAAYNEAYCSKEKNWRRCYKRANDTQKKELDALKEKYGDQVACYIREARRISGLLESDRRITIDDVEEWKKVFLGDGYDKYPVEMLWRLKGCIDLNVTCPDFCGVDGADGKYKAIYYLDDEQTEYIEYTEDEIAFVNKAGNRENLYDFPEMSID